MTHETLLYILLVAYVAVVSYKILITSSDFVIIFCVYRKHSHPGMYDTAEEVFHEGFRYRVLQITILTIMQFLMAPALLFKEKLSYFRKYNDYELAQFLSSAIASIQPEP